MECGGHSLPESAKVSQYGSLRGTVEGLKLHNKIGIGADEKECSGKVTEVLRDEKGEGSASFVCGTMRAPPPERGLLNANCTILERHESVSPDRDCPLQHEGEPKQTTLGN